MSSERLTFVQVEVFVVVLFEGVVLLPAVLAVLAVACVDDADVAHLRLLLLAVLLAPKELAGFPPRGSLRIVGLEAPIEVSRKGNVTSSFATK